MMAVLSGTRVVRILFVRVATLCCRAAKEGDGVAVEFDRRRLNSPGSTSTKRFLLLIMPKRRDCTKSARESRSDLNRL